MGRRRSIEGDLRDYLNGKSQDVINFCKRPKVLTEEELRTTRKKVREGGIAQQRQASQCETLGHLERRLNGTWRNAPKLSLLITKALPDNRDLHSRRPATHCNEIYEYYKLVSGNLTGELFGTGFMDILRTAPSKGSKKNKKGKLPS